MPKIDNIGEYYRSEIIEKLGLTIDDLQISGVEFPCEEDTFGQPLVRDHWLITEDEKGNLVFTPVTLEGSVSQMFQKKTKNSKLGAEKVVTYSITRYKDIADGENKYNYPSGFISQLPYNPPNIIKAWRDKTPIPTLVLTEGYKKAAKGAKHGLYIQGLPSITMFTDKELGRNGLMPDIVRLIKYCQVENVIILWDGDCRNIGRSDIENNTELTRRPYQFFNMVAKLRELLKDYGVDVYFAHVKSDSFDGNPKGLDDLLMAAAAKSKGLDDAAINAEVDAVAQDLVLFDGTPTYFYRQKITANSFSKTLLNYFALNHVQAFYDLHEFQIGAKPFIFNKRTYENKNGRLVDTTSIDAESVRKIYRIPDGVDIMDYIEFGFYQKEGCYYVVEKEAHVKISNFTMSVKHLIKGIIPKRLIEITNIFGKHEQVEVTMSELISVSKFKEKIEGLGNFLFEGTDRHLGRIKQKLFVEEQLCQEFSTLGYQAQKNMWVWANGIYDLETNTFIPVDEAGMVNLNNNTYYLPYYSNMHPQATEEFGSMRKFAFERSNDTNFSQWAKLFYAVYGDNGMIAIAWLCSAIFVDIIFPISKGMPMLFAFGAKGSGKGTMVSSIMHLFGEPQDAIMLSGTSTAIAFMRKLAQIKNGIVWLDEFSNSIDPKRFESLKNIWDRIGQERGRKSNDTRTENVPVNSSAIISGQDLPTNNGGSLFSRIILTEFIKTNYSDNDINLFTQLITMQEDGLTQIVHELLSYRHNIANEFKNKFRSASNTFRTQALQDNILLEERTIKNYAIVIATFDILISNGLTFPFSLEEFLIHLYKKMDNQQAMIQSGAELQTFWEQVYNLLQNGAIKEGNQISIKGNEVAIRLIGIMPDYLEACNRQKLRSLPIATLRHFLETCNTYIATKSYRFSGGGVNKVMLFDKDKILSKYGIWLTTETLVDTEEYTANTDTPVGSSAASI